MEITGVVLSVDFELIKVKLTDYDGLKELVQIALDA